MAETNARAAQFIISFDPLGLSLKKSLIMQSGETIF
jgi:hypothetical protein